VNEKSQVTQDKLYSKETEEEYQKSQECLPTKCEALSSKKKKERNHKRQDSRKTWRNQGNREKQ
jgi:hypothetical protein